MRIFVFDYSGHPFQVQLSRELARRGHDVTHSYCPAYPSGKGRLVAEAGESLEFATIGGSEPLDKHRFALRLVRELGWGLALVRAVRRRRPEVAMMSNAQIPTLVVFALAMKLLRVPWVLWHQDVYAVAVRSFAGDKLGLGFRLVASCFELLERWSSRQAAAIVAIAEPFVPVHAKWGTADKVTVIPNWAPLDEIVPRERKNDWAVEHQHDDTPTLLYSGTLGLKHNPELAVRLARAVLDRGQAVRLVVVSEGAAVEAIRNEAARLDVETTLLPFQPYDRLPEVLASGDVLLVLLEAGAGEFSVPSKTLSYLAAGRPIVGLMPVENLAGELILEAGGYVAAPHEDELEGAADWVTGLLGSSDRRQELGRRARTLAEQEFSLTDAADRFESILTGCGA